MINRFAAQLRSRGYRMTPQRLVILQVLLDSGGHLTPVAVFRRTSELMPGMTEATVYRTLSFLTEQGLLTAAHIGNGQLVYELAGHAHHHLVCRACGQTREIDHVALESLYEQFQKTTGFRVDTTHVTFFGLCPDCQK
jgi:Fe2+ or Zn2+ uptake regulation protein